VKSLRFMLFGIYSFCFKHFRFKRLSIYAFCGKISKKNDTHIIINKKNGEISMDFPIIRVFASHSEVSKVIFYYRIW